VIDFPEIIYLQTHSYCNFECTICPYPKKAHSFEQGYMEDDLFYKITEEITANRDKVQYVRLMLQNEPFIDKTLFKKVRYIKQICNTKVSTTTNGSMINESIFEEMFESGLDTLGISLNAMEEETFKKITNSSEYNKIVENIILLLKKKPETLKVMLSFVITRQNIDELKKFQQHWTNLGAITRAYYANNRAGEYNNKNIFFLQNRDCNVPFREANILFNGDVILCRPDWDRRNIFGNLYDNTLQEIWNSEQYANFRENFKNRINTILPCKFCNRNGMKTIYTGLEGERL